MTKEELELDNQKLRNRLLISEFRTGSVANELFSILLQDMTRESATKVIDEIIEIKTAKSALQDLIAKVERMTIERCYAELEKLHVNEYKFEPIQCAYLIRALQPNIKLEDL